MLDNSIITINDGYIFIDIEGELNVLKEHKLESGNIEFHRNTFLSMVNVVAAIIQRDSKILIARRAIHKSFAGKWEFPGGKIEDGEEPEEALERELNEEFKINAKVGKQLYSNIHDYGSFCIQLFYYHTLIVAGDFYLIDHDRVEWVDIEDVYSYDLLEADIPVAKELVNVLSDEDNC